MLMHQQHFKTIMATKILRIAKIKIELCDFVKTCNKSTCILRIHEYPRKPYQGQTLVFFPALTAMAPSVLDKSKTFTPKQLHKFNYTNQLLMNQNLVVLLCSHTKSNSYHHITTTYSFPFPF